MKADRIVLINGEKIEGNLDITFTGQGVLVNVKGQNISGWKDAVDYFVPLSSIVYIHFVV